MRSFRIYIKGQVKQQLVWLGALMLVVAIAIATVAVINYLNIPEEAMEEYQFSARALISKELYVAGGVGVLGILFLLAGTFAANHFNK